MNNSDKYRKAVEEVRASEELKEKTIQKIKDSRNKKKLVYLKYLSACAVFVLAVTTGKLYYDRINTGITDIPQENPVYVSKTETDKTPLVALNKELPRFASLDELEDVLKENNHYGREALMKESAIAEDSIVMNATATNGESKGASDYSKTNVQVENVDEADIVKTDGKNIYYITQGSAYIIKADNLEIVNKINLYIDTERFSPFELYVN